MSNAPNDSIFNGPGHSASKHSSKKIVTRGPTTRRRQSSRWDKYPHPLYICHESIRRLLIFFCEAPVSLTQCHSPQDMRAKAYHGKMAGKLYKIQMVLSKTRKAIR